MQRRSLVEVVRRSWAAVLVCGLLGLTAGLVTGLATTPTYRSTAGVFFSLTNGSSAADLVQGSTYAQNQVQSFAELATAPVVLAPVVERLQLDVTVRELAAQVSAVVPVDTVIVEVTVTDPSPERSARIADAVTDQLSAVVEDIAPTDGEGESTVRATTIAPAEVPDGPASPDVPLHLAVGLVAGLLGGLALVWGRSVLDTRVRDLADLPEVTDLPVLGALGTWQAGGGRRAVVVDDPHSTHAEAFRQLRTNLRFLRAAGAPAEAGAHVVAVTSSLPGEGKSSTSVNLALTLAETGARVLLVDADLRRPAVAGVLDLEGSVGLTTVLSGQAALEDLVQPWGDGGLDVLTSGAVPPNPAELLGSPAMRALIAEARGRYDLVVVDTPPTLPVADAAILSPAVDGIVVVAHAGRVRRTDLHRALAALDQVGARVLGVVVNRLRRNEAPYDYRRPEGTGAGEAAGVPAGAAGDPVAAGTPAR
ncbi:polysaccharide biosynthesis tyrosine autokinase [Geodermatophilus sp. SYSU D01119]